MPHFLAATFLTFLLASFAFSAKSKPSTNGDVAPCLQEFYSAVYHETYNCTNDYDFLSVSPFQENSTSPFITGKACFLEVVKSECTEAQYNLLETKYDDFLRVILTQPKNPKDCSDFYFKYNALKCNPIAEDFTKKAAPLAQLNTKQNDSRVLEVIDLCHHVQECIKPICFATDYERITVDTGCKTVEMKNSGFMACLAKIQKTTPDMSKYKCIGNTNFYDPAPEVAIEKLTRKKACLKEIMTDVCGESGVDNFEEYTEYMLKVILKDQEMKEMFASRE